MSMPAESKKQLLALLFAWPLAVLVGWLIGRITHTDWPVAVLPVLWLAVLFVTLRRHTSLSR